MFLSTDLAGLKKKLKTASVCLESFVIIELQSWMFLFHFLN